MAIKSGRPYTDENGWTDNGLLDAKPLGVRRKVLEWIRENIKPRKTPLYGRTSYGMKHILQRDTGIYLTNNEFKDAMLKCGFYPVDPEELNWTYRISAKSPAFKIDETARSGFTGRRQRKCRDTLSMK